MQGRVSLWDMALDEGDVPYFYAPESIEAGAQTTLYAALHPVPAVPSAVRFGLSLSFGFAPLHHARLLTHTKTHTHTI
jgi:hypothetical protein